MPVETPVIPLSCTKYKHIINVICYFRLDDRLTGQRPNGHIAIRKKRFPHHFAQTGGGGGSEAKKVCVPKIGLNFPAHLINHLKERLLDQAQARASYTPLFGGHLRSIPQGMIFDVQPLVKSLFCPIRPSPNGFFDSEASIP